jgi:hypothetical protein
VKPEPSIAASTALVARPEASPWDDVRLQKLWLGLEERGEWRSLSVLSASEFIDTIRIAELLVQLAWRYRGQPAGLCDLRDMSMRLVDYQVQEMRAQIDEGRRLVVALRSIFENPTATLVAKQTDAILLCIALGETHLKAAEQTIAAVGRDRVLGSLVLRPRSVARHPTSDGR